MDAYEFAVSELCFWGVLVAGSEGVQGAAEPGEAAGGGAGRVRAAAGGGGRALHAGHGQAAGAGARKAADDASPQAQTQARARGEAKALAAAKLIQRRVCAPTTRFGCPDSGATDRGAYRVSQA